MSVRYDPDGNRIYKKTVSEERKYIVDIVGGLPVILMELNNSGGIVKTYIYANSQIIAQHTGDHTADRFFYLHDRLGSVRQVIDDTGAVVNFYTYNPWGMPVGDDTQTKETKSNMYLFAGYVWDAEISQYHCFRRQYDPVLARFTSRDPVQGNFKEPMTLHTYLYCLNDPINKTDPSGEFWSVLDQADKVVYGIEAYYIGLDEGLKIAGGNWEGILVAATTANTVRTGYFGKERAFWDLLLTEDAWDRQPGECQKISGYYRHCLASCRLNRLLIGSQFGPAITYVAGLTYGNDWYWQQEYPDTHSDRRAYRQGIRNSYKSWDTCQTSCRKSQKRAIEEHCN